MKNIMILGVSFAALAITTVVALNLQSDPMLVKARYLQLTCERCDHMEVQWSSSGELIGKTILPISNALDMETILVATIPQKESLCLQGKKYLFTLDVFGFDPGGSKFLVQKLLPIENCDNRRRS